MKILFCLASCGIGARDYYAPFDSSTNAGVLSAVQKALGRTVETQIPTRSKISILFFILIKAKLLLNLFQLAQRRGKSFSPVN